MFEIVYWYEDPCDASYDCEKSVFIKADSSDEAIAEFKEDYGNHNILSITQHY